MLPEPTRSRVAVERAGLATALAYDTAAVDNALLAWLGYPAAPVPHRRYYLLPRSKPVRVFPVVLEIP